VQATEKAQAFREDFGRISKELRERIFRGFTDEEQQRLAELMVRAIENFE
jgi:DNA-binding MarR family transcriptional regulator